MELKSMEMSEEERKEYAGSSLADQPKYPYGLRFTLDDDAIDRLGFPALPQVGETMIITARVQVANISQYESENSDKERSIGLQITDMAVGPDQKQGQADKTLYGG